MSGKLPLEVLIVNVARIIRYYYDGTGNKLQKRTTDNTTSPSKTTVTTYIDGAVYINDTLEFFGMSEGRVRANTAKTQWIYDYFLKDHLGNTRMMITDDYNVASPILEASSYYPFGLQQKGIGLTASSPIHNFKNTFQKQEYYEDPGVDLYEFKYRMDDPQIGRFLQVDPLPDKYVYNSTYAFSENHLTGHEELEGLEKISANAFYKAATNKNVQKYSKVAKEAWGHTANIKISIGAGEFGGKMQIGFLKISLGGNGPELSATLSSGNKVQMNSSLASFGSEVKSSCGSVDVGGSIGNIQYKDGHATTNLIEGGAGASLGASKTIADEGGNMSETGELSNSSISVGAKIGAVGVEVKADIFQGAKAMVNTIGSVMTLFGSYVNEKIHEVMHPEENIPLKK